MASGLYINLLRKRRESAAVKKQAEDDLAAAIEASKVSATTTFNRRSVTSSTTIAATDYYLAVSITESATLTLPSAATLTNGQTFVIKDEAGTLSDSVVLSIAAAEGQTIENVSTYFINAPDASIFIYTDGSTKYYIY